MMPTLTADEWREIYGLLDKRLKHGHRIRAQKNPEIESKLIQNILDKIGPDGHNMIE